MIDVAKRIGQVDESTRQEFVNMVEKVAAKPSAAKVRDLLRKVLGGDRCSLSSNQLREGK